MRVGVGVGVGDERRHKRKLFENWDRSIICVSVSDGVFDRLI